MRVTVRKANYLKWHSMDVWDGILHRFKSGLTFRLIISLLSRCTRMTSRPPWAGSLCHVTVQRAAWIPVTRHVTIYTKISLSWQPTTTSSAESSTSPVFRKVVASLLVTAVKPPPRLVSYAALCRNVRTLDWKREKKKNTKHHLLHKHEVPGHLIITVTYSQF